MSKSKDSQLNRIERKLDVLEQRERDREARQLVTLIYSGIFCCCLWIGIGGPIFFGVKNLAASMPSGVNFQFDLLPKINWNGIDLPPFTSNKTDLPKPGKFPNPVPGARLTSPYGYRIHPTLGVRKFHNGQDLAAPTGTPIKAPLPGKVVAAGWPSEACGNGIKIDHPSNWSTSYCHLSRVRVRVGQSVNAGSVIGLVGNTGRSTGPHLHLTLKKNGKTVDPAKYFDF